jgi:peptidoglycan/xylan/chitin deacetylase (PgdA/CDA1 family)
VSRASDALLRALLHATGRGKLTIMICHRVHEREDPLFPGEVDARRFDALMSRVAQMLRVLPLGEALDMLRDGRLPSRAACITFDDGYADNADVALPILQRHRACATFFIATGYLDGGRMWNDTVIEALRRAPGDFDATALELGRHRLDDALARRAAIDRTIDALKYAPPGERQDKADALARLVGTPLPNDLMMRSDQVRALCAAGMSIGAHTVTHPILRQLDPASARAEMADSRAALRALVDAPVTLFAYPNGKPGVDYGPEHVAMARELGFAAALSTRRGAADAHSEPYELPRFTPWGDTPARFAVGLARNNLDLH